MFLVWVYAERMPNKIRLCCSFYVYFDKNKGKIVRNIYVVHTRDNGEEL
jgi:hypothetical protein